MPKDNSKPTGIWKLLSVSFQDDDGTVTYPYGREARGLIVIDARGYYSSHLVDMRRPLFKVSDPRGGTPEEAKAAFEGYLGYYGTYDLDEDNRKMVFHVMGSWMPNWIGGEQVRYYELDGNHLTITTAPVLLGKKSRVWKLRWERAV